MFLSETDIADVINDSITVAEGNDEIINEAQSNLWTFSLPLQSLTKTTAEHVLDFLNAVVRAREQQLNDKYGDTHLMVFYCWFDEQAAQLRFSLVSKSLGYLPFRCTLQFVENLTVIVRQFLDYPYQQGVPLEEFQVKTVGIENGKMASDAVNENVLDIWRVDLPRREANQLSI